MAAAARRAQEHVIDLTDYLRETISEMDEGIAEMQARRESLAIRLAVIEAAQSDAVRDAAADYDTRMADGRPYDDALPAEQALGEAWKRFAQQ